VTDQPDKGAERHVHCPGCDRRILPGEHVHGVAHEDPWQALWHLACWRSRKAPTP
jgi:hypothetical protein